VFETSECRLGGISNDGAELERQLDLVTQRTSDLRKSFEDYKKKVQREIRRKKTWRTISIIELVVILVGGAACVLSR